MSITKSFIVSTAGGRKDGFINLIESMRDYASNRWRMIVNFQKYSDGDFNECQAKLLEIFGDNFISERSEELTGCHLARVPLLEKHSSDIWVLVDDDMEILPSFTDYEKIGDILIKNPNIGCISGCYKRYARRWKLQIKQDELVYSPMVYTDGGLCFRQDVADIIKQIPKKMYIYDTPIWSTYAYMNGYDNCRYRGSIAIHKMCGPGGYKLWKETNMENIVPLPEEYIETRFTQWLGQTIQVCTSECLTPLAHELHERNKIKI